MTLRRLLILLAVATRFAGAQPTTSLSANFSIEELADCLTEPTAFAPADKAYTPFWENIMTEEMRDSYIRLGQQYLHAEWPALPATLFAEFKTVGNRVNYEKVCFERRRQLAALAMAEVAEGKGHFLNDIINGIQVMTEETWWGLPAHYGKPYPMPEDQNVDLFNAEAAGLLAWVRYMLSDSLDARSPLITQRIDKEIERRILTPALTGNYWWKTAGMNWNPWICSNWLTCVLFCEKDRQRQIEAVAQIMGCIETFISSYPEDGGCDEGPGYWDRAAASAFECLALLRTATHGRFDRHDDARLKAMGSYVYKSYIQNGYCLNFADAHGNRAVQQVNVLYPYACFIEDDMMKAFAKYLWQGDDKAGDTYNHSGNFPTLGREILFLSIMKDYRLQVAAEPNLKEVWLPDLQIRSVRNNQGLFVAIKGGHNDESHNHNDVGEFVVYADGQPLLVDPGVGEYTSKTFSQQRYEIWTMQSDNHNLPQINGFQQADGASYKAKDVVKLSNGLRLDIATAYPKEADVRYWRREVRLLNNNTIRVKEDYELNQWLAPACLHLITPVCPQIRTGEVVLDNYRIRYNPSDLNVTTECLDEFMDPLLTEMWQGPLYRITLTVKGNRTKGHLKYTVTK